MIEWADWNDKKLQLPSYEAILEFLKIPQNLPKFTSKMEGVKNMSGIRFWVTYIR